MAAEFKTLWELYQEGAFEQLAGSARSFTNISVPELNSGTVTDQAIIGIIALIVLGLTFLPFGATESSIKACQGNLNQKVVKFGSVLIVVLASLSAILFLEVLELSEAIGSM